MTNVLLLYPEPPPTLEGDSLPLGLAAIGSYLRTNGIAVTMVDLNKQTIPEGGKFDLIGIGAASPYFKNSIKLCHRLRKEFPGVPIVLGGSHFSSRPEDGTEYADTVVVGEGELAMLKICKDGITQGIVYGETIDNLDDIPIEPLDLLDAVYKGRDGRLYVMGSRGCPFNCTFCRKDEGRIRNNSVEYLVEKLDLLVKRYHGNIVIADDIFVLNKKRAHSVCDEILRRNIPMKFVAFGHVRHFDRDLLLHMQQAGLSRIAYGIESGNDKVLKTIRKGFTIEQAEETIARTFEAGVEMDLLYMVGNMGDTSATIRDTVRFALKHNTRKWCSCAIPFPGTQFEQEAEKYGTIVSRDYERYTNRYINFLPHGVSAAELEAARNEIMDNRAIKVPLRSRVYGKLKKGIRLFTK